MSVQVTSRYPSTFKIGEMVSIKVEVTLPADRLSYMTKEEMRELLHEEVNKAFNEKTYSSCCAA